MDNRDFMDNMSLVAGIYAQKGYVNNPERTSSVETDDFSTGNESKKYIDYEPSHIQNWIKTNRREGQTINTLHLQKEVRKTDPKNVQNYVVIQYYLKIQEN